MIRRIRYWPWLALLFITCQWMTPTGVVHGAATPPGVSCQARMTNINFGIVDTLSSNGGNGNYNLQTTAYLTYLCTNTSNTDQTITACFNIGDPYAQFSPRYMQDAGGNQLNYQIYLDTARTQVWSSAQSPSTGNPYQATITIPAQGHSVPITVPVYAIIPNQSPSSFDNYTAVYGNGNAFITTAGGVGIPCASTAGNTGFGGFSVMANFTYYTCQITTNPMTFAPQAGNPSGVNATAQLTVACPTANGNYSIGLDNGQNYAGTSRRMLGGPTNSEYISYGLYQSAGSSVPWGNTLNTDTMDGLRSKTKTYTIYGQINTGQPTPSPGNYFDLVTVYVYF